MSKLEDGVNMTRERFGRILFLSVVALAVWALAASAAPGTLLTTTGQMLRGSVSGIGATVRLTEPETISTLEPVTTRDIESSKIVQITIDYPRILIETEDNAYLGPFSAFSGISESLRVDTGVGVAEVPTTAVRAVALNGHSLREPARLWVGDGYLTMPSLRVSGAAAEVHESSPVSEDEPAFDPIVWNSFTPTEPATSDEGTIPWWVGLLVVGALVALLLLMNGSGSSSWGDRSEQSVRSWQFLSP